MNYSSFKIMNSSLKINHSRFKIKEMNLNLTRKTKNYTFIEIQF